jgi:hypothetical protein
MSFHNSEHLFLMGGQCDERCRISSSDPGIGDELGEELLTHTMQTAEEISRRMEFFQR